LDASPAFLCAEMAFTEYPKLHMCRQCGYKKMIEECLAKQEVRFDSSEIDDRKWMYLS
jgi:hypothetical protein